MRLCSQYWHIIVLCVIEYYGHRGGAVPDLPLTYLLMTMILFRKLDMKQINFCK